MIELLIVGFGIASAVYIPLRIAKLRKLAKLERELEAAAMERGSIPPPLPQK